MQYVVLNPYLYNVGLYMYMRTILPHTDTQKRTYTPTYTPTNTHTDETSLL